MKIVRSPEKIMIGGKNRGNADEFDLKSRAGQDKREGERQKG